jgi:hypothetical protein
MTNTVTIHCLGVEIPHKTSPFFFMTIVGPISVFFVLVFPALDLSFGLYFISLMGGYLWPLIILTLITLTGFFVVYGRLKFYSRVHRYEIKYSQDDEEGGKLGIQYTDLNNFERKKDVVKEVRLMPGPLRRMGGGMYSYNVSGTTSSLELRGRKRDLLVGFQSIEEMRGVYLALTQGGPIPKSVQDVESLPPFYLQKIWTRGRITAFFVGLALIVLGSYYFSSTPDLSLGIMLVGIVVILFPLFKIVLQSRATRAK